MSGSVCVADVCVEYGEPNYIEKMKAIGINMDSHEEALRTGEFTGGLFNNP